MDARKLVAELVGTALLVFFGAGTATLCFGFKLAGSSTSAGVLATAFAFGLGADGHGHSSMIGANAAGAFVAEVVLRFLFVFVILSVTKQPSRAAVAGLVIGLCLALVHIIGIPIDGTSVNPARSIGPALFVGGSAVSQLWVFIVAPLAGGSLSAGVHQLFYGSGDPKPSGSTAPATAD